MKRQGKVEMHRFRGICDEEDHRVLAALNAAAKGAPHAAQPTPYFNFAVEGTIGAGKSTLISTLAEALPHKVIHEPVADNPYLEDFYADTRRWSLAMQVDLLAWRTQQYLDAMRQGQSVILDRSIYGDRAFCHAIHRSGLISDREHETYLQFHRLMTEVTDPPVDFVLYLRTSPEVAWKRIQERARGEETTGGLTLEYLQTVGDEYDRVMEELEVPVHTLEWDEFLHDDEVWSTLEWANEQILESQWREAGGR